VNAQDPNYPAPPGLSAPGTQPAAAGVYGSPPGQRGGGAPTGGLRPSGPRRRPVLGVIAVAALVLALFSTFLSWRAAGRAADAADQVKKIAQESAGSPAAAAPAAPATADLETQAPVDPDAGPPQATVTGGVPELNAKTEYKVKYTSESLRIPSNCGQTIYIDLDEPRVKAASEISELQYSDICGSDPPKLSLETGVVGSEVDADSVTPVECAEQIRTSPMPQGSQPLRRGQVYCFTTSLDAARSSANSWKMIVLSVSAIAPDDTVSLKASAWDIPQ
jgi:hypothetical protein